MSNFSRAEYESLLYSLTEQYAEIATSTLRMYPDSRTTALVRGSIYFKNGLELRFFESLDLADGEIFDYSYTVFYGSDKVRWYDPQPHPEVTNLQATFPHHRHEPPEIRDNRRPALGISFQAPNLPTLINDCIELGRSLRIE